MTQQAPTDDLTRCGCFTLLVVCPWANGIDECLYPSQTPCKHGAEGRRQWEENRKAVEMECVGDSAYSLAGR